MRKFFHTTCSYRQISGSLMLSFVRKGCILLSFLLLSGTWLGAQITITNSVFPVVGDTLRYHFGNQAGAINKIFTPPGGAQAWDLSGLQATQSWNQVMKDPATGAHNASFTSPSVLFNPPNSTSEVYWKGTGNQVLDMGYFGLDELGLGLNLLFDKIPDLEESWAPINFFDIHQSSSNVLSAFDAPLAPPILLNLVPTADSFRIRVTYQRISAVDAWGTMTIPGGTFDVLRKKRTEYRSIAVDVKVAPLGWIDISTIGGQQLLPLGTDTIYTFHFLNNVSKEAIAICTLNKDQNAVTGVQYKAISLPTASAGDDQTLCITTPAQLNATLSGGTPAWSVLSGPSTASSQFSSTDNPLATFTPAGGPGTYTLLFTVTDGTNVATDDVAITFNEASIIDAGPDQTVCPDDIIQLHATLSGAATNMVWQKNVAYGTFIGSDTDPNATFQLNANGKAQPFIKFGAMSNDPAGPCQGGMDTVTIFINTAGADQALCITDGQAQLAAGGSGTWSVVSGPSTANSQFSSTTNPDALFTPAGGFGVYTLRWTTSLCIDDVVITFGEASIINAGPDQTVCPEDIIQLHATLSGAATNMVWQKNVAYGTFIGPDTDPNATFQLNATGKAQPFIKFGAMSNDPAGPCQGGMDTVTIFINTAGADQALCITDGQAQLAAGGSGTWSVVSGPSTANSQFSSTTNPEALFTPAGGPGTYTLRWTTSTCTDDVVITFGEASIINAGPDQTVCPDDIIQLHATLSGAATNMVWQKNVAYGTFIGPDTDPNATFQLNATGKAQPFIKFGAMSNDPSGPCPSGMDTVTIFINTAGADQSLCITDGQAQLAAGGSGTWSIVSGPSTANSQFSSTTNPDALFTPAGGFGVYTLRWTTSLCTDDVVITFGEASIINAGPDQTVCPEDIIHLHATLSGAATNMVWEKNVAYGVFIGPDTDPNATFQLNATGKAQPFIKFGAMSNDPSGPCQGGMDTVTIFIKIAAPEAVADAYHTKLNTTLSRSASDPDDLLDNDKFCVSPTSLTSYGAGSLGGAVTDNAAGTTVPLAGGSLTVNADGSFSLTAPTVAGVYTFQYRLSNTGGSSDATVTITVLAPTLTVVTGNPNPSCFNTEVTFTATVTSNSNPVTVGTVTFKEGLITLAADIAVNSSGTANFTTSTLTAGNHTITAEYNGSNEFDKSSGNILQVVNNVQTCSITGTPVVCPSSSANFAAPPGMFNYSWTVTGNGSITGSKTSQTVTVQAGLECNKTYTLSLSFTNSFGCNSSCTKIVTVEDNTAPALTGTAYPGSNGINACKANAVAAAPFNASNAVQGYTDDCGRPVTAVLTNTAVTGTDCNWTVTYTFDIKDGCNNTLANQSYSNTGSDQTPPTITGLSVDPTSLWPPNHKMRDVYVSYTAGDNCSQVTTTLSVSSNEPQNGTGDGDLSPDWIIGNDGHSLQLRAERAGNGNGRIYTITVTTTDGCGNTTSKTVNVYVVHNITAPATGNSFKVGSTVNFEGSFWDKPGNRHTGKWVIDDKTFINSTITEPSGNKNGKSTGSYKFNTPGVYKLQMNITDQNGITSYANTNGDLDAIVVIYDPNGGYTYGGGWFASPVGALKADPSATGKVSYGFTMNYYKNATFPKGESQFEFKVGNFEYNALNFDYLSIQGAKAQFRGTGKIIGGQSGIAFIMTVIDGALDGTGVDKVRMKIFNKNTNFIYYDNQPGASDASNPVTPVGANSTVVIGGNNGNSNNLTANSAINSVAQHTAAVQVSAAPNPLSSFTVIRYVLPRNMKISLAVYTTTGQKVAQLAEGTMRAGVHQSRFDAGKLANGVYIYRLLTEDETGKPVVLSGNIIVAK